MSSKGQSHLLHPSSSVPSEQSRFESQTHESGIHSPVRFLQANCSSVHFLISKKVGERREKSLVKCERPKSIDKSINRRLPGRLNLKDKKMLTAFGWIFVASIVAIRFSVALPSIKRNKLWCKIFLYFKKKRNMKEEMCQERGRRKQGNSASIETKKKRKLGVVEIQSACQGWVIIAYHRCGIHRLPDKHWNSVSAQRTDPVRIVRKID